MGLKGYRLFSGERGLPLPGRPTEHRDRRLIPNACLVQTAHAVYPSDENRDRSAVAQTPTVHEASKELLGSTEPPGSRKTTQDRDGGVFPT